MDSQLELLFSLIHIPFRRSQRRRERRKERKKERKGGGRERKITCVQIGFRVHSKLFSGPKHYQLF
jgi:hypothetical protein